jgi:hypothetical protein
MALSYPLNTPTNIGIANITLMAENAVAISQSPFTFQQQIVAHPGQRWSASISLPPMKRQDAENWVAFLLSLKGQVGTFLLGDPNCFAAQGSATTKRNLLTFTEQFNNAAWQKLIAGTGVTPVLTSGFTDPDGGSTAWRLQLNAGANGGSDYSLIRQSSGAFPDTGTRSIWLRSNTGSNQTVALVATNSNFRVTVTPIWQRFQSASSAGAKQLDISVGGAGATGATADVLIWHPQFEASPTATTYQGVVDAYGPFVNGAGQTGDTLLIDGCSPDVSTFFKAGDYIQLGSGTTANLYKVLTDTSTNSAGQATLDIWPNLRSSPGDNDPVVVASTKGKFRLKDNITQWSINEISSYGITFDCVEAI